MFFQAVSSRALEEGTVIEVTVTRPDGEQMASNVRLTAEDIALFRELNVF
jgi:hypothetical protein